jgi:hypothetical protein
VIKRRIRIRIRVSSSAKRTDGRKDLKTHPPLEEEKKDKSYRKFPARKK